MNPDKGFKLLGYFVLLLENNISLGSFLFNISFWFSMAISLPSFKRGSSSSSTYFSLLLSLFLFDLFNLFLFIINTLISFHTFYDISFLLNKDNKSIW